MTYSSESFVVMDTDISATFNQLLDTFFMTTKKRVVNYIMQYSH